MIMENKLSRVEVLLASLHGRILDVGGSAGTLNEVLRQRFPEKNIIALDVELLHARPNMVLGDGQRMPFRDRAFDSILAGETIEHIRYYRQFLQECWRVLEDNGVLALSTPNVDSWFNRLTHSYHMPLHVSLFGVEELKRVLREEGFTVQRVELFPYTPESSDGARHKWLFPIRSAVHHVVPATLREDMVIVARKVPRKGISTMVREVSAADKESMKRFLQSEAEKGHGEHAHKHGHGDGHGNEDGSAHSSTFVPLSSLKKE